MSLESFLLGSESIAANQEADVVHADAEFFKLGGGGASNHPAGRVVVDQSQVGQVSHSSFEESVREELGGGQSRLVDAQQRCISCGDQAIAPG